MFIFKQKNGVVGRFCNDFGSKVLTELVTVMISTNKNSKENEKPVISTGNT